MAMAMAMAMAMTSTSKQADDLGPKRAEKFLCSNGKT